MAARSPENGAGERWVLVRLRDIPPPVRLDAAVRLINRGKLAGSDDAAELLAAAIAPFENPGLRVPVHEARRVLG